MTGSGHGLAPTLAFFALMGLAALTAAAPAAFGDGRERGGGPASEHVLAIGASVFLVQLGVFVLAAGMGAAPFLARVAALGVGVAATLPGAAAERGAAEDARRWRPLRGLPRGPGAAARGGNAWQAPSGDAWR